jgi:hypothetical protein
MAEIHRLDDLRPALSPQGDQPRTPNQELLARIDAMLDTVTPEERLMSEIRGTEEALQALHRKYDRLLAQQGRWPTPGAIAEDQRLAEPQNDNGHDHDGRSW